VVYADKESAAAAVAEFNSMYYFQNISDNSILILFYIDKHIPQWNTRLLVSISDSKKRNLKDAGKGNNDK
jgi:hypothetical protein